MAKRRSTSRAKQSSKPLISSAAAKRFSKVAVWALTLFSFGFGLTLIDEAFGYRQRLEDPNAFPLRIEWVSLPGWMEGDNGRFVLDEVEAGLKVDASTSPAAPQLCAWIYHRAEQSPWIDDVERVTKTSDGRVRVAATFREPLTMVVDGSQAYLVDHDGVRLSVNPSETERLAPGWIPVYGAAAPAPAAGLAWPGDDVADGLRLVHFIMSTGLATNVERIGAVDVSRRGDPRAGGLRIRLINPPAMLWWGRAPGREFGTEAPARDKLAKVEQLLTRETTPNGVYDVRAFGDEYWNRTPGASAGAAGTAGE